ncbi:hypothetical protein V8J88_03845 [Massilia sp. W12]|uniref:hypothetical protein n=1 Tax=Massilia sp. W12 TaxID=3126507 RepID=UPI0030CAFA75
MIPGKLIKLGDREYTLPPLSAGWLRTNSGRLATCFNGAIPPVPDIAEFVHAALLRNYPDVTQDEIDKWVDTGNAIDLFDDVMQISGMALKLGELQARMRGEAPG